MCHPATQVDSSDPPRERGVRLALVERCRGSSLRVTLDEYRGAPYLALRVWAECGDGVTRPVRGKGVSVRLSEAEAVARALLTGLRLARANHPQAPTRTKPCCQAAGYLSEDDEDYVDD